MALSVIPFIGGSWWKREGNKIRGTFGGTKGEKKTPAPHSLSYSHLYLSLSFHPPLRPLFPCVVLLIFGQSFCIHEAEIEMEMRAGWAKWAASAVAAAKRGPQRGKAHHRLVDTCQRQRGLGGHHPASHSPRLPAPDINHCIRETKNKTAPTRVMKNYWQCRSRESGGVQGGKEGRNEGDLVPFYLRQARRLVTFTREKKR